MDFEWKDVEKKLEEEDFKKEKSEELSNAQKSLGTDAQQQPPSPPAQSSGSWEPMGLAAIGYETWNQVAVDRGAEPISDEQKRFLDARTRKLEEKWLKNIQLLPEIEALMGHIVVYVPKYAKYLKTKAGKSGTTDEAKK